MAHGDASRIERLDQPGQLGRPGMLIDERYRLEALIGAGGFGEVWRASQEVEGSEVRHVALKLLGAPGPRSDEDHDSGPGQRASGQSDSLGAHNWLDEVRAVRDVRCSSIATIYDVGIARQPRVAFIAMELLSGRTLEDRAGRGPVYWRRALAMGREVARALVTCHKVGVVHCDLKPHNVFLAGTGQVYVLDFGVAALGSEGRHRGAARADTAGALSDGEGELGDEWGGDFEMGATGAVSLDEMPDAPASDREGGRLFGTPGYIAPESFAGRVPSPASDVYALGVLLYRIISGRLPQRLPPGLDAPLFTITHEGRQRYHAALNTATVRGDLVPLAEILAQQAQQAQAAHDAAGPPESGDVPAAVIALIESMLALDPARRPTEGLLAAMDQAWRCPHGIPDPPYVGLAAFDVRRAGYIAGRDADIEEITAKLRDHRAVVLCGPSGCGKSSLAIAGVAPRIDAELMDESEGWRLITVRPSQGRDGLRLAEPGARPRKRNKAPALGVVVVVDQLEEILRLDADERGEFCEALASLVEAGRAVAIGREIIEPGQPARVIATVRDDLFGPVAGLPELRRFPEKNLYTVRGVEPNAMPAIVEGPARSAGFALEAAAEVVAEATRIVAEDPGALPLVQFALTRWWEMRDRDARLLSRPAWHAIGGIEGALAEAAQALYDSLSMAEKYSMRALLVALFRHDGTRVRVVESAVVRDSHSSLVLDRLVERRLVSRHESESGDSATLEVVHEALGRRWPLLHTWLEETRAERELIHDARHDTERWQRGGEPADLLWRGARLEAALALADKLGPARGFIDAAARARAEQRWRKRATVGLLFGLLGLAVVLVLGYLASSRGQERARRAYAAAVIAQEQAESAREQAEAELLRNVSVREETERALERALVERQAAQAERVHAEAARKQAEADRDQNVALRRDAEIARRAAEAERARAETAMREAQAAKQEAEKQSALASTQLREANKQRTYAETATRLHEMARRRMEQIEVAFDRLESQRAGLAKERDALRSKLEICRKGS